MNSLLEEPSTPNSLLNFVCTATSSLKFVFEKPVKPKRRVNHRKYLQRQLKGRGVSCTVSYGSSWLTKEQVFDQDTVVETTKKPSAKVIAQRKHGQSVQLQGNNAQSAPHKENDKKEKKLEMSRNRELKELVKDFSTGFTASPTPLRKRKLPESFWSEPKNCSKQSLQTTRHPSENLTVDDFQRSELEILDWLRPELDDFIERWSEESERASNNSSRPSSLSDSTSTTDPCSPYSEESDNISSMDEFFEQRVPFSLESPVKGDANNGQCARNSVSHNPNTLISCSIEQNYGGQRQLEHPSCFINGHFGFTGSSWGSHQTHENYFENGYTVFS